MRCFQWLRRVPWVGLIAIAFLLALGMAPKPSRAADKRAEEPKDVAEAEKWFLNRFQRSYGSIQFNLDEGVVTYTYDGAPRVLPLFRVTAGPIESIYDDTCGFWGWSARVHWTLAGDPFDYWIGRCRESGVYENDKSMIQFREALIYLSHMTFPKHEAELAADAERARAQLAADAERARVQREQLAADKVRESQRFEQLAAKWRALNPKPPLSEEVEKKRLLAEDAYQQKNLNAAVRYYEAGVALDPTWAQGWYNVAQLYAAQNDFEHAIFSMKRYLILLPNAPDAAEAKNDVLLWEAKADEAAGK